MSEARLLAELTETKAEVLCFRERMSIGTTTVHKNLSLTPRAKGLWLKLGSHF